MAAIASTIGTARGSTQASWRPAGFQCGVYSVDVDCFLFHQYGGDRFEDNTEIDILSVAQTALDTTGVVGMCFDPSVIVVENIVLFGTSHLQSLESFAVFECFGSVDT